MIKHSTERHEKKKEKRHREQERLRFVSESEEAKYTYKEYGQIG